MARPAHSPASGPGQGKATTLAATLVVACIALYFGWFIRRGLHDIGPASFISHFDWQSYFRPRFWLGSAEILQRRLPIWNEYEWGGLPLLATGQPAALYPPKVVLYALLDPVTAHWVFLVFHYALFCAGFWLFLLDQGMTGPALFAGTVVPAFGTLLLSSNYHPVRIGCFAWMPLQFLLAERVGRDGSRLAFAGLSLVVMVQLLAGYPEFPIDVGFLLAIHATVSFLTGKWRRPPWLTVPVLGVAFVIGAVAAGAQLLPLAELARISQRVSLAEKLYEPNDWMMKRPVPLGSVAGLMVFVAIAFWQKRARSAFLVYFVCWGIAAGGWKVLRLVPGFSMVRFPFGWVLFALFPFGWLTAIGCQSLVGPSELAPRLRRLGLLAVAVSGVALAGAWAAAWYRSTHGGSVFFDVNIGTTAGLVFGALGGLSLAAVALASCRWALPPAAWLVPLGLVTLAHLAAAPHASEPAPFEPSHPRGLVARLHGKPQQIRGRSFAMEDILYGHEITDRLPSPLGIELSFLPQRCRRIMEVLRFIPTFGAVDWGRFAGAHGFLDAMNVDYIAGPTGLLPIMLRHGWSLSGYDRTDALFRNPDPMGRAWVSYAVRRIDDPERLLSYVLGESFEPHREVIVERPLAQTYPEPGPGTEIATPVDGVFRASPTDLEYAVTLPHAGILVVSESAYPGWTATVDGAPAEWFTADYLLRGVELSAGSHVVRYRYQPKSVRLGLLASALGLSTILGLFVWARRARTKERARPTTTAA